ncbi:MAG: VWA domain-containing protein [Bacteroides sp.]|nr:VWA domain-containing protein [Bacteroides sp.]
MEKTTVFNLIILDESGSMEPLTKQTISGCNETLNVVRSLQAKYGDTQRNLVSLYLFQSDSSVPSRYLVKNTPIGDVSDISTEQYHPWGCTPLLDAVGSTLVDLKAVSSTHEDATGVITIITDGMENSSTNYNWAQVASLIKEFKEQGWVVNLIGANIDVEEMARKMEIESTNTLAFKADEEGTKDMWASLSEANEHCFASRVNFEFAIPPEERTFERRKEARRNAARNFFKKK